MITVKTISLGIMGDVYIDEIGDRIADYSLLDMTDRENGTFHVSIEHVVAD